MREPGNPLNSLLSLPHLSYPKPLCPTFPTPSPYVPPFLPQARMSHLSYLKPLCSTFPTPSSYVPPFLPQAPKSHLSYPKLLCPTFPTPSPYVPPFLPQASMSHFSHCTPTLASYADVLLVRHAIFPPKIA